MEKQPTSSGFLINIWVATLFLDPPEAFICCTLDLMFSPVASARIFFFLNWVAYGCIIWQDALFTWSSSNNASERIWPHCGAFCGPEKVDQKLGTPHISQEYWTDNGLGSPGNCFPPRMISNLRHLTLFWWNQGLISRSWKGLNPDVWQYARETEESKGPDSLKKGALLLEVVYVFPFSNINYSMHHFFLHFSCNYGRFYGCNESASLLWFVVWPFCLNI